MFNLACYINVEIYPASCYGQLHVYVDEENIPVGFVTWAKVNEITKQALINDNRSLYDEEWNCGEYLFFNDFVAPWGGVKIISSDLKSNLFPNEREAFSIRRDKQGNTKKINHWKIKR